MNILQKLLYWGFNGNSWCWFHILAGSLENCKKTYGSVERWVYDCIGDIVGAIICAGIVIW